MTIELNPITSGYSTGLINDNFQAIEDYVNAKLLNRDGLATGEINQMELDLDMNSHFIYNLPEPTLDHQAARLQDVKNATAGGSANLIDFTPYGYVSSDNLQTAIQEIVDETTELSSEVTVVYENLAQLGASTSISVGDFVDILGRFNAGDGGSNTYEIVAAGTGTHDGGTLIDLSASGLQAKGLFPNGIISPSQFGADNTGTNSSVTAFQRVVDYFPDNSGPHEVHVAPGSYSGDLSTLTLSNRVMVWHHVGRVVYSDAAPFGEKYFTNLGADKRPWFEGVYGFTNPSTASRGFQYPNIDSRRNVDHTNNPGNLGNNGRFTTNVNVDNPGGPESALTAVINANAAMVSNGPLSNITAFRTESRRTVENSNWNHFGANIVAKDTTLRASSISSGSMTLGGMVGLETNVAASGPDDAGLRRGHTIIMKEEGTSPDAAGGTGLRSQTTMLVGEHIIADDNVTLETGIHIDPTKGTNAHIAMGINMRVSETGIRIRGIADTSLDIQTANGNLVRLGSLRSSSGDTLYNFSGVGQNSASENISYSFIRTIISSPTDGSEHGRLDFLVKSIGSDLTGFQINGQNNSDPISLQVGGSLKRITQGAVDSGGAGFRILRVPN